MAAISRLGYGGYGVRRAGSFVRIPVVIPLDPQLVYPAPIGTRQKYIGRFHIRPNLYGAPDYPLSGISGTLVATEDVDVSAILGDVSGVAGTLVATEGSDTAAFSGTVAWTTQLVATEGADVAAFSGSVTWTGTLVTTEGADTAAFSGNVAWTGTLVATEGADTAAFSGNVAWTTQLVATEGADTAAMSGSVTWTGTLVTTEGADVMAFQGAVADPVSGTLVTTEGADTASFSGSIGNIVSGTLVATENADIPSLVSVLDTDTYYNSTVLLSGFEGGMTDESPAAHGAGTAGTGVTVSSTQVKFGRTSLSLTGSGALSWPDSADWALGTGRFTVEGFFYPNSVSAPQTVLGQWGSSGSRAWLLWLSNAQVVWQISEDGSTNVSHMTSGATSITAAAWHHIAIDYDGTKYRLYLDGVMVGSSTVAKNLFDAPSILAIGPSAPTITSNLFNGFVDELRITKGAARYASDSGFTVPTAPFPRAQSTTVSGNLVAVEGADTAAMTGTVAWTAQLVATEAADTASFNALGSPVIAGTLVTTEAADTASFSGSVTWTGTLVATEGADTAAITGLVRWTGTLAATEASDTASFNGTVVFPAVTGTLVTVEAQDTANFVSIPAATCTLVAFERPDTCKILGQPIQEPGDLNFGWPRVKVRRRL